MALKDVPVIGNVVSWFDKDGAEMTDAEIASVVEAETQGENKPVDYGKDVGNNFFVQLGAAGGGVVLGGVVANKLSDKSKFWTGIGALAGAVIMHKVAPELATDIQRGNQYADQQSGVTGEKTSLKDRFKYIGANIMQKGQSYEPDPDLDV